VCLDDRTSDGWFIPGELDDVLADQEWSNDVREFAGLGARLQISQRDAHEYSSASHLLEIMDFRARPHWTVLATDVCGLPWYRRSVRSRTARGQNTMRAARCRS
jgi:hypothetical protein